MITLNGTTGITNDGGYTGDGVVFADTTPANTLVTTTGGNVGIGTASPRNPGAGYRGVVLDGSLGGFLDINTNTVRVFTFFGNGNDVIFAGAAAGAMSFQTNGTERARIDSGGNFLWGTTTAYGVGLTFLNGPNQFYFERAASTGTSYPLDFRNGGSNVGYIAYSNTGTTYSTSSDYRLKENIQPMTGALAKVAALKPVTYKWKVDGSDGQGFIAHELQAVMPDCVLGEKDAVETYTDENGVEKTRPKYQGIDTSFLVATLTAAIQEQQAIITAQAAQIQQLREKVLEVEEGTSNMLIENTNNLYETITALTARVAALDASLDARLTSLEGTQP